MPKFETFYKKYHEYFVHGFIVIGFAIYAGLIQFAPTNTSVVFFERDPDLSYPNLPPQVSTSKLGEIAVLVPAALVIILTIVRPFRMKEFKGMNQFDRQVIYYRIFLLFWLVICAAECLLITTSIFNTIKVIVGRHRPHFFALCNYAGYADAWASGNFSQYLSATEAGAIGSLSKCLASANVDHFDGFKSFPSGHASISFASMLYCVYLLRSILEVEEDRWISLRGILAASPLVLSTWISITRYTNFYHHVDDIVSGALIGLIVTCLVWKTLQMMLKLDTWSTEMKDEDIPESV